MTDGVAVPQRIPASTAAQNPHYQALGGEAALRQLVTRFYELMDALPQAATIRAMHPADLTDSRERLFMFLSGWLGGPPLYAQRHGPPRLRRAHLHFPIDDAARDAWLTCMMQALEEQVSDAALRNELSTSLLKTADFLKNK